MPRQLVSVEGSASVGAAVLSSKPMKMRAAARIEASETPKTQEKKKPPKPAPSPTVNCAFVKRTPAAEPAVADET
jgi:hypothetical protein